MYFAGIDIGSVSTDVVIIDEKNNIKAHEIVLTGPSFKKACEEAYCNALKKADLVKGNISSVVSTGYGRKAIEFSNQAITEIRCHATGIFNIYPEVRTLIDIGGQDCKVISINEDGTINNFVMNDKCAAGTGRFVDVMARALQVDLSEMGVLSLKSKNHCKISSICTVFAESEVISKLSEDNHLEDIIKGIHVSIAEKIMNLVKRVGKKEKYCLSGGGGKNIGIVKAIEELLDAELFTPENPQIVGALGAAIEAKKLAA